MIILIFLQSTKMTKLTNKSEQIYSEKVQYDFPVFLKAIYFHNNETIIVHINKIVNLEFNRIRSILCQEKFVTYGHG